MPSPQKDLILEEWKNFLRSVKFGGESEQTSQATTHHELIPLVTPIALEVSDFLTPWVNYATSSGKRFLDDILPLMKTGLFYDLGVQFPGVRVRGCCSHLPDDTYVIKINEVPVAVGKIPPEQVLVNCSADKLAEIGLEGEATTNPANGMDACWVPAEFTETVEEEGYGTWDVSGYIILHLSSILRRHAYKFVGLQEVQNMLDKLEPAFPTLIHSVVPEIVTLHQLTDVLKRLVTEDISICNLKSILELVGEWGAIEKDTAMLTEYVRMGLKEYITHKYARGGNSLMVYLLDPMIEQAIQDSICFTPSGNYLAVEPEIAEDILDAIRAEIGDLPSTAQQPVLLTNTEVRRYLHQLIKLEFPYATVLSFQELNPDMNTQPVARISVREAQEEPENSEEESLVEASTEADSLASDEKPNIKKNPSPSLLFHLRHWLSQSLRLFRNQRKKARLRRQQTESRPTQETEARCLPSSLEQAREAEAAAIDVLQGPYPSQLAYFEHRLLALQMWILTCSHRKRKQRSEHPGLLLDSTIVCDWLYMSDSPGIQLSEEQWEELERQRSQLEQVIRQRAQATRMTGFELSFERMKEEFGLHVQDEWILLLALAHSIDPTFPHFCKWATTLSSDAYPYVGMACILLTPSLAEQRKMLHRFAPQAPLHKHGLLVVQQSDWKLSVPLEKYTFFLEPSILLAFTDEPEVADTKSETFVLPQETLQSLALPTSLREELQDLTARFLAEKGPGQQSATEEPHEELFVLASFDKDKTPQQSVFGGGAVFLLESRAEEEVENGDAGKEAVLSPRLEEIARQMSASVRRSWRTLDLATLAAQPDAIEQMIRLFQQVRLNREVLYVTGVASWKQAQGVVGLELLRTEVTAFPGMLFVHAWQEPLPTAWQHKVVYQLTEQPDGSIVCRHRLGPALSSLSQRYTLEHLEEQLMSRVIGQESALREVARGVRTAKTQLTTHPERPDGVFLLVGPSGVGKTETAIALNDILHGRSDTLLRIDMSELHFRESASALIGTTAGYIGFDQGGRLTNFLERQPEAVILLDEIEKAHPQILDLFLQVFDAGRITDGRGRTVDCSQATFLLTSNIGAEHFDKNNQVGFLTGQSREQQSSGLLMELRRKLRPEFLNRMDEILVFQPLSSTHLRQICERQLQRLQQRFARRGIWLNLGQEVADFLLTQSKPERGVRDLHRLLNQHISQPLTDLLLAHPTTQHVILQPKDDRLVLETSHTDGAIVSENSERDDDRL